MGHLQRAVYDNNTEQLIEDILIAKLTNMNFFRLTQMPVQPEVYDLCDRLGMMLQTDLPLFGTMPEEVMSEAIKQAGEMERLVRSHPSNIMVSFINEPYPETWDVTYKATNRNITREEMERFFRAAREVVLQYNPDRVIKAVDGDYNPPAPFGMPDYHLYAGWYGDHGVPLGKLHKGYWMPAMPGWVGGCGEHGAEGLEAAETMLKYYPAPWLPASRNPTSPWSPAQMKGPWQTPQQSAGMSYQWFDSQETMQNWITVSQQHQSWVNRWVTRSIRRQADRLVSNAIHLLIDAYPSGWQKAVVDVDRRPKQSWFTYRDALSPLLTDLRTDRYHYQSGDTARFECWVANDKGAPAPGTKLVYEVWMGSKRLFAQRRAHSVPAYGAECAGLFAYRLPAVRQRTRLTIKLGVQDNSGKLLHDTEEVITVFPARAASGKLLMVAGLQNGRAWQLARKMGYNPVAFDNRRSAGAVLVDSPADFVRLERQLLAHSQAGATVLLLNQPVGSELRIDNTTVKVEKGNDLSFVSRKSGHPLVKTFLPTDFSFWYDPTVGYINHLATTMLHVTGPNQPLLLTAKQLDRYTVEPRAVATEIRVGKGRVIINQLRAAEFSQEPVLQLLFDACLQK